MKNDCETALKSYTELLNKDRNSLAKLSIPLLRRRLVTNLQNDTRDLINHYIDIKNEIDSLRHTIAHITTNLELRDAIFMESGESEGLGSEGAVTTTVITENITDVLGDDQKFTQQGSSLISQQGQREVLQMGNYLSRPVEIYKTQIAMSTDVGYAIPVWDTHSLAPSVRAKLRNYAYLKGNLKVRIAFSGTPQHYGRFLISYQPYPTANVTLVNYLTAVGLDAGFRNNFLTYLSQAPGAIVVNVNENKPIEMELPYLSTKPMHRMFSNTTTALAAGTSFPDLAETGTIYIYSINQVKSVTATPSPIYFQVYAWYDSVELGTNTATQIAITTESGKSDERVVGPVERFASSVFSVTSRLSDIPVISPFMKASSVIASALSSVSAIFGWSKPVLNQSASLMKPQPFENGAYTIGYDTSKRVVLDPKQEVTVDPRLCGVSTDDMIISTIAARKTLIDTFTWAHGDVPMSTICSVYRVSPMMVRSYIPAGTRFLQPAACAYAAAPFYYWRGTVEITLEFVVSKFHRGKMAVFYEPNYSQFTIINSSISTNKQFLKIIDIQETQTVTFCVPWASYRPWLRVASPASAYLNNNAGTYSATESTNFINGYIGITPFTQLQSPDNSDIPVNVYVSCPDLQVNGLTDANLPTRRLITVASGRSVAYVESGFTTDLSTQEVTCFELNESTASTQHLCEDFFGEQPLSFRALLKRFVTIDRVLANTADVSNIVTYPILPSNQMTYNAATPNYLELYSYLRYAYVGMKGGMRFRLHSPYAFGEGDFAHAKFSLKAPGNSTSSGWSTSNVPTPATLNGSVTYVPAVNGGLEVEFPFYSNNLFALSFSDTQVSGVSTENMSDVWYRLFTLSFEGTNTNVPYYVLIELAAAEDFSFMRFQGAPCYSV